MVYLGDNEVSKGVMIVVHLDNNISGMMVMVYWSDSKVGSVYVTV